MDAQDDLLLKEMAPKEKGIWQGYTANTTADQAGVMFKKKYGVAPKSVLVTGGAVHAGPVPQLRLWRLWDEGKLEEESDLAAERNPNPGRYWRDYDDKAATESDARYAALPY